MKRNATLLLAMMMMPILLFGCASLRSVYYTRTPVLASFKDPAFAGARFQRLAVVVDTADLQWRHDLEVEMVKRFRTAGIAAVEGFTIIPPTRAWSERQAAEALAGNGLDGYLRLVVDTFSVTETVTPVTTTTTRERQAHPGSHDSTNFVQTEKVTTKREGGERVQRWRMRYRIQLIDLKSHRTAWVALNQIDDDPRSRLTSFCDEIAGQLLRDTLVEERADVYW